MSKEFIMVENVRCSFPHLFKKPVINGDEGKCGVVLMLDPKTHKTVLAGINTDINALIKDKLKGVRVPSEKRCLRDGIDKGRPEYEGYQVLSANNRGKPIVISSDGKGVITDEEENPIYAGCFVNAKIRLWAQDNNYGKRINAELVAIQFTKDGEALDASYVSVDDAMDGFSGSDSSPAEDEDEDFLSA